MTPAAGGRPNVAILCLGKVGAQMASPAIRAYELGRALRDAGAEVRLLAKELNGADELELPCAEFGQHKPLRGALNGVDIVLAQPQWPRVMRDLRRSGARLIFDLYYPDALEKLEHTAGEPGRMRDARLAITVDRFNEANRIGHQFICASEIQRDLWLGTMLAQGLITPEVYDRDPSMRSVIDAVPFGVPGERPRSGRVDPWANFDGIEANDEVVLWNGGIWPWLDAQTAVRAIGELAKRRPHAKLLFMAGPNDDISREAGAQARALAGDLGLLDRNVFFNDGWVPYDGRGDWMTAASCALHCHGPALETRFAFRTRAIDCFWAGLPVVSTDGDMVAEEIQREDLGAVAPQRDPAAVAGAIERVLERGRVSYAPALERAAARYRWSKVAEPLADFVMTPGPVPRLGAGAHRGMGQRMRTAAYFAAPRFRR